MDRRDERRQLRGPEILQLIDGEQDTARAFLGDLADGDEKIGDVVGQVPAIGLAPESVDVD